MHTTKPDSAMAAEMYPDIAEWSTVFKTNAILADIYDALNVFNAIMAVKGTKHKPKEPEKYPRPWKKKEKSFKTIMKAKDWLKLLGGEKKDG